MTQYRAVRLFTRYGSWIAGFVVAALIALTLWAVAASHIGWLAALGGVAASLLVGFLLLVFVDLTRILSEMLLPR